MKIELFDYELPKSLIAQEAVEPRDHSRLMVMNRKSKTLEHRRFYHLPEYLIPGDLLVLNNTRVIRARLFGQKETGANIEIFLLKRHNDLEDTWVALAKPGKRIKAGTVIDIKKDGETVLKTECLEKCDGGKVIVKFNAVKKGQTVEGLLKETGNVPLPPYINRELEEDERYQTVYAKEEGAVAAPTAGLHFTPDLMQSIEEMGVGFATATLHVGLGTFRPVEAEDVEEHTMHSERFFLRSGEAEKIFKAKREKRRIIAVGTTSVRVLETIANMTPDQEGHYSGETDIYIYPPYRFKLVDTMITNFHLPKSTLLLLLSAFAGREFVLASYARAVEKQYRFFSLGDSCLIL